MNGEQQGQLSAALTAQLQARGRWMQVPKHTMVFECGAMPHSVYWVKHGLIRLSTTSAAGREAVLGVLGPGQCLGETSLFADAPRLHDAVAVQDSELLVVHKTDFRAVVDDNPVYLRELLQLMSHRYRAAMQWIDRSILLPFPVQLARRLLFEAARANPDGGSEQGLHVSQQSLGHMLGVSRQSVNKQLKLWERQGWLELSYGRVRLVDVTQLEMQARAQEPVAYPL